MRNVPTICIAAATTLAACRSQTPGNRDSSSGEVAGVDIYSETGANRLSAAAAAARPLVYVPNSLGASVSVIDPRTYAVVRTFKTGKVPQHVVPSWDLKTLWVANNAGNSLTPIVPSTGAEGTPIPVDDPYNLYFTPDGKFAMVIAEKKSRVDWLDPQTMQPRDSTHVDCKGIDHVEFTADARYAIATCEFSGELVKLDLETHKAVGYLLLDPGRWERLKDQFESFVGRGHRHFAVPSMPQDIRSSPDGRTFYVADMQAGGVYLVDPVKLQTLRFIPTGVGTHGIYPSRDGRLLYVTNRGSTSIYGTRRGPGSITVLDPETQQIIATWAVPGGGSPDMGNVTADGKELWVSGRYDDEVYVFDTASGKLTHRIPVGRSPHGLCVWPQPGRYSLGHTGNMR